MSNQQQQFLEDGFGSTLWLDIVNSEHYDGFGNCTDHLQDVSWLATFLAHYQFSSIPSQPLPEELLDFRQWLRHIAQKMAQSASLAPADVDILNRYLREPGVRLVRYLPGPADYRLTFQPVQLNWRWVLAETAVSLAQMLNPQKQKRIKICPNPGCNWVFFDTTRGNNRRWCNDLTCGNRDKVRRHRSRQNPT
ncbi:MAG: CGNR zinc finger domain-containing protein [Anaerolineales bacterium]|nr:CGNR zinc finger domain-containing protein [Anaerolineales bacterium]